MQKRCGVEPAALLSLIRKNTPVKPNIEKVMKNKVRRSRALLSEILISIIMLAGTAGVLYFYFKYDKSHTAIYNAGFIVSGAFALGGSLADMITCVYNIKYKERRLFGLILFFLSLAIFFFAAVFSTLFILN